MSKKDKKKREYLFSGSWEDRLPAIFYSCMILALWLYIIFKEPIENTFDIKIPLIISFLIWGIITYILFKICNIIMALIMKKKKENYK